jgi:hypothetical protein
VPRIREKGAGPESPGAQKGGDGPTASP